MKRWLPWLLILAILLGLGTWWFRGAIMPKWFSPSLPLPKPDAARYAVLTSELERWRIDLSSQYRKARTADERASIERDARVLLDKVLPAMMRCWLGTPWDFNGTASHPGGGKIACGYFVATVLKDAGFDVDRYRLAQQASSNIIHSFIPKEACTLRIGIPYETFTTEVSRYAPGIYLVGLDTHVGFLVKTQDGFRFIHSSGSRPWCVVDESPQVAHVLQNSQWRMLGNLSAEPQAIRAWLKGRPIKISGT